MQLSYAKNEFMAGQLKNVILQPSFERNGWLLECQYLDNHMEALTNESGQKKIFNNLDKATAAAKNIGFTTINVEEGF